MKILLVGALGRMGANVIASAAVAGHECVAFVDIGYGDNENRAQNEYTDINEVNGSVDVIVDFSHHSVTEKVVEYAASHHTPVIIATTGHTDAERANIIKAAERTAVFMSGNMSLGIATMCDTVRRVLSVFPDADVEIVETHHNRKLDAPSGTALMLFDAVKDVRPDAKAVYGREGKRERDEVGIASVRMGNIVGIHEVMIGTDSEQITIRHQAFDRALFADGAVRAAEFIMGKPAGMYDMKDMFRG